MDLSFFEGFDYEPGEIDDEIFLSQAPLSLLEENIRSQFEEPGEDHKTDFVQTFLNKYLYTKQNDLEEEDDEIEGYHDDFILHMENLFREFLSVGIPNLEDEDNEYCEEMVHYLYRFFIINIKKNFVRLVLHFIEERKDWLYDALPKTKDIAHMSYKDVIDDEVDLTIISNIYGAVKRVLKEAKQFTIDDFFEYARSDATNLEIDFILEKYDNNEVNGNFVEKYIDMIDPILRDEITCKVKNKLLKKYTNN